MPYDKRSAIAKIDKDIDRIHARARRNTILTIIAAVLGVGTPLFLWASTPGDIGNGLALVALSMLGLGAFIADTAARCRSDMMLIKNLLGIRHGVEQADDSTIFTIDTGEA